MQKQFDVSHYGFLPSVCCNHLPENFKCFQNVLDKLEETKSNHIVFRKLVHNLPYYDVSIHSSDMLTKAQMKFMYSILTMIINRYIWCNGVDDAKNFTHIPAIIAVPLHKISCKLGIVISLTHASVDLWNWRQPSSSHISAIAHESIQEFDIDTCEINHTMTGNISEEWFYKIMVAIEGVSGPAILLIPNIYKSFGLNNNNNTIEHLQIILKIIKKTVCLIKRMYEKCDPDFFFNHLRIYLGGSNNDNLPNGVNLDLSPIHMGLLNIKYAGGSAAQSTLIQVYDDFFGVKHKEEHGVNFLKDMRNYMPLKHRQYLEDISMLPSLSEFVKRENNHNLTNIYSKCLSELIQFRKSHISLVHKYIMKFVKKKQNIFADELEKNGEDIIDIEDNNNAHGAKGTGGTDPVTFCTDLIKDTIQHRDSDNSVGKYGDNDNDNNDNNNDNDNDNDNDKKKKEKYKEKEEEKEEEEEDDDDDENDPCITVLCGLILLISGILLLVY
jgi:indoleamine 2,3-dioxygenase